jgi:regulator of RNase E activity RraA
VDKYSQVYYDQIAGTLYTAVIADILDDLGYTQQTLRADIRPMFPEAQIVGRAATLLAVNVDAVPKEPYLMEMELLDDLKPGEVFVCNTQGCQTAAIWGELLSTHTRAKGGRGAIIDGFTRDVTKIIGMRFPVFATGIMPADSKGRLDGIAMRVPIEVGGVRVNNGDLIVADYDGCVVVPQAAEDAMIAKAMQKVSGENKVRDILARGASIKQVFKEHGIL